MNVFGISCQSEKSASHDLVGAWVYERQIPALFTFLLDEDRKGTITFYADQTGDWISDSVDTLTFKLTWELEFEDQQIRITKFAGNQTEIEDFTGFYNLVRIDDSNIELNIEHNSGGITDTERIILSK